MAEIDTVLDNQEVTAQTLNDIAIDLGNTSFNGFGEEKFGADALNTITGDLVSAGVLLSGDKCEVDILNDKVVVKPGIIVFATGAKKKITENVELEKINNSFIYALNDTAFNVCKLVVSQTEPVDGDFVMLAKVNSDGTVTDNRMFAKSKVELLSEGSSYVCYDFKNQTEEVLNNMNNVQIEVPLEGVTRLFVKGNYFYGEYSVDESRFRGISSNSNIVGKSAPIYSNYSSSGTMTLSLNEISKTDEKLVLGFTESHSGWGWNEQGPAKASEIFIKIWVFGGVDK